MASELFKDLLDEALRRDCSAIPSVNALQQSFPATHLVTLAQIAEDIYSYRVDFVDALNTIAKRDSYKRAAGISYICPQCRSEYCLRAIEVRIVRLP